MNDIKKQKTERELMNEAQGIKVDVDFQVMVENNMQNVQQMAPVSYSMSPCSTSLPTNLRSASALKSDLSSTKNSQVVK